MLASSSQERSRIPTTGMRGGLGRTLLTAFLILAIVPLSAISWYATLQERRDIQREVTAKLSSVAAMMEMQIRQWTERRTAGLACLAALPDTPGDVSALVSGAGDLESASARLYIQLQAILGQDPSFRRLAVLNSDGRVLLSTDPQVEGNLVSGFEQGLAFRPILPDSSADGELVVFQRVADQNGQIVGLLAGWFDLNDLAADLRAASKLGDAGEIYLVDANGVALPQRVKVTSPGIEAARAGDDREGLYENYAGVPVIGVYRWMPELKLALVAEQTQDEAFAPTENVTAAVVGATLVVALVTAVLAAVVTRQITRPIVLLTESALRVAEGDMEQRVLVASRDEIGILAYVFNRMTAELKALYDDLEAKVAQRTALLQRANYQVQRRAIQLATTVKVSQAATSILERDKLLRQVVRLVHNSFFAYSYVGIYLLDDEGKLLSLEEGTGGKKEIVDVKSASVRIGDECAVCRAARTGEPCIVRWKPDLAQETFSSPYIRAEAALPLVIGGQIIGVLDILSTEEDDFDADDVSVLQNVANQIVIALENARAYAVEREAAERLRELDRSKRRFLANMSHELRTPLTNILGFSRLMLKKVDGPLTQQAQSDLEIIYSNGQRLLDLINDLLDVSQIEAGLMELEFRDVDLTDLINGVMATTSALVRDKEIELHQQVAPNLPLVQADRTRIRQVLLLLLANAAKFTEQGSITVSAWPDDGRVVISVSDTGVGIPLEDRERIFERFERGTWGPRTNGAGLGLALSKEFVEMHGGRIWVESTVGKGSTFTFTLPLSQPRAAGGEAASEKRKGL